MGSKHIWNFSSVGGVKRVNIESGSDLLALDTLDQKLWTALSCPVNGLEIDDKTLALIDSDKDGRIRVPEILEAVRWITSLVNNADDLLRPEASFPIAAINQNSEEGRNLYASARQILLNLDKPGSTHISVDETSDTIKIFEKTRFNGDGIITEASTDDEVLKQQIADIMLCEGAVEDRSGKPGISTALLEKFLEDAQSYSDWYSLAEADSATILPYGDKTADAFTAFVTVQSKVEDFFIRCRLAAYDARSTNAQDTIQAKYEALSLENLSKQLDQLSDYPLAEIEAGKSLPVLNGINPAWEEAMERFVSEVINPVFQEKSSLTETEWKHLTARFKAYKAWQNEKKGEGVELLGVSNVRNLLKSRMKEDIISLIESDKALEKEADNIILVDKLARYYRDIYTLLRNFVTFYDFYSPGGKAIFQSGSLFLDQRSCDLCIKVSDMPKHATMVSLSGMYLIYCECVSQAKNEKMTIMAAMTNGDIDNLIVGRNAIFYDRKGLDWDATIIKIVENPISIRQAFFSPYRKAARFIEQQIDKMASAREKEVHAHSTGHIEHVASKIETAPKPPPVPFDVGKFVGIFAAIGLALGAIGGVLASMIGGFVSLTWWKMPLAFAGLILAISGPSMIIAFLKLRKRNLAPILDANGWAINARAIVNIPFGNTLTHLVQLPKNAKVNLNDPFTKKKSPFLRTLLVLAIIAIVVFIILWKNGFTNP
jgi:hypothetical protein